MRTLISIIAAVALAFTCAAVEITEPAANTLTLDFDANITTGYSWTAFVLGGESAVIDEENSGYVSDDNPDFRDGVGGTHYFTVTALQPGETIIRFTYARGLDEISEEIIMLIMVDEEMNIYATDVTEMGVYDGTVLSVNAEDNSIVINTERMGEVIARFNEGECLPAEGEHVMLYTDGTITMSLPGIVNVIAWSAVADDMMR